jgi:hypothetical protein
VTLKDEQLMAFNGSALERIYPSPPIGHITSISSDHADFRTLSGHIVRVPGERVETTNFEDYGWWVVCEKP